MSISFTELLQKSEYSFLSEDPNLGENIILLGLGGSHAYGTNTASSDLDIRGIAKRRKSDIFLSKDFEQVVETETDTTIYSLEKMVNLLMNANPNTVELLGLRPDHYLAITHPGEIILENKKAFLSKRCISTFAGYANAQLYRLQQKTLAALTPEEYNAHIARVIKGMTDHLSRSWGIDGIHVHERNGELVMDIDKMENVKAEAFFGISNEIINVIKEYTKASKRNRKAIDKGKVNKHAMHLLRLYMMGCDLLEKQEIVTYRKDEHDLLMSVRNGEYEDDNGLMKPSFFDLVKEYEKRFNESAKCTDLPDEPDTEVISRIVLSINRVTCCNYLSY